MTENRTPCPCEPCPNPICRKGVIVNPDNTWRDVDCPTCQGRGRVMPKITPERLKEIGDDAGADLAELGNAGGKHLALTGQSEKLLEWLWAVVERQNEILGNISPPITDEMVEAAAIVLIEKWSGYNTRDIARAALEAARKVGVMPLQKYSHECGRCDEPLEVNEDCSTCQPKRKKGKVFHHSYDLIDYYDDCPTCQGKGRVMPEISKPPDPGCRFLVDGQVHYCGNCSECLGSEVEIEDNSAVEKMSDEAVRRSLEKRRKLPTVTDEKCGCGGTHEIVTRVCDVKVGGIVAFGVKDTFTQCKICADKFATPKQMTSTLVKAQRQIIKQLRALVTGAEVEAAARSHHEAYERLAPNYNYSTNVKTRVPWDSLPENNQLLMLASERAALEAARKVREDGRQK